ncbi:hypothetical protein ABIE44_000421 [Marmoricola sp. OAE513]|uniref:hypothetical protein n=1 Tax=Marmoricola sp. OAE513 TaxID=2817894 RepID=UPI001AE22F61
MVNHAARVVLATTLVLGLGSAGCSEEKKATAAKTPGLSECRKQWGDVADAIVGLDEDKHPSALASRWTSVVATVDYYENTDTATDCQQKIAAQLDAITALRQFSTRLQPYDMEFQADERAADVGRYLADPLPAPTKGKGGKKSRPPKKAAVAAALKTLEDNAAAANAELAPGWGQLASVELTDEAAVKAALQDLEFLAKDSPTWVRCNAALAVIEKAVRAQLGLGPNDPLPVAPTATSSPTSTPSSTPGGTPSGTPATTPTGTPSGTPTSSASVTPTR